MNMKKKFAKVVSYLLIVSFLASQETIGAFAQTISPNTNTNTVIINEKESTEDDTSTEQSLEDVSETYESTEETSMSESVEESTEVDVMSNVAAKMAETETATETETESETVYDAEDINYGYVASPDPSRFQSVNDLPDDYMGPVMGETLPSSYRTPNLPNTKNQNPYGTCWAHSSISLAEISMMKQGYSTPDYSELHLSYFTYNLNSDPLNGYDGTKNVLNNGKNFLDGGGNVEAAGNMFASSVGAVDESVAPYSTAASVLTSGLSQDIAYDGIARIKNTHESKPRSDIAATKQLVYDYGAAGIAFYVIQKGYSTTFNNAYTVGYNEVFNETNNCYYFPYSATDFGYAEGTDLPTNHAITIVGWDDSFSKNKFATPAPADGAWLIRNSWTTNNSNSLQGYFWLSYYDNTIEDEAWAFEFEPATDSYGAAIYDNTYQYDRGLFKYATWCNRGANVFTAHACKDGERLSDVSFSTISSNVSYTINVYTDIPEGGIPTDGTLATYATTTGTMTYPGMTRVTLSDPVPLKYGERYAVEVILDEDKEIAADGTVGGGYAITTKAKAGEGYVYRNNYWYDYNTYDSSHTRSLSIKAYTKDIKDIIVPTGIEFPDIPAEGIVLAPTEVYTPTAKVLPVTASNKNVSWSSDKPAIASVDSKTGKITACSTGTAIITATTELKGKTASFKVVVDKDKPIPATAITAIQYSKYYPYIGDTVEYSIVTTPANASQNGLTWSSSNPSVLSIDETTGIATAKDIGQAVITAKLGALTKTYTVNVSLGGVSKIKYVISDDNTVTYKWDRIVGAEGYRIYTGPESNNLTLLTTISDNGSSSYEYVDETYKNNIGSVTYKLKIAPYRKEYESNSYVATISFEAKPTYTITYNVPAHAKNSSGNVTSLKKGGSFTLLSPICDPGYSFDGWYTDSSYTTRIIGISNITSDRTIYAKVTPITYNVKFNAGNSGYRVSGSMPTLACTYDEYKTLPLCTFTSQDATFREWNTAPDGSGTSYADGASIRNLTTVKNQNVILYAQWDKVKNCDIIFDSCGGCDVRAMKASLNDPYGELPIPTYAGYHFDGWFTKKSGGTRVTETTIVKSRKLTVYAHWSPETYTITFDPQGGAFAEGDSDTTSVIYGALYGPLPTPLKAGYTFFRWYYDDLTVTDKTQMCTANNHTLKAEWKPTSYIITLYGNGGLLNNQESVTMHVNAGGTITLPTTAQYDGYTFDNFYINNDKSQPFNSFLPISSNMCIYANWIPIPSRGDITDEDYNALPGTTDEEKLANIPDGIWMSDIPDYTYTGAAIKPAIRVYDKNKLLIEKTDYTVAYSNNKNAATKEAAKAPTVTITGKGNYNEKIVEKFNILPEDISGDSFNADNIAVKFTGKKQKPAPVVTWNGKKLTSGRDFTFTWENENEETNIGCIASGEYTVTITGKGNFAAIGSERDITYKIGEKGNLLLSGASIKVSNRIYDGTDDKPAVTVKYGRNVLIEGEDYNIEWPANTTDVGTIKARIVSVDGSNYIGNKSFSYKITGTALKTAWISGIEKSYAFTGSEICPAGTEATNAGTLVLSYKQNGELIELSKGTDYTISYDKNINAGTAKIIITGIGKYTGKLTKTFKINKMALTAAMSDNYSTSYDTTVAYCKAGCKPKLNYFKIGGADGLSLIEGTDYTLKYLNNKAVRNSTDAKAPTITLTGKGNYSGTITIGTFTIEPTNISTMNIYIPDKAYANTAKNYAVNPVISEPSTGTKLQKGAKLDYLPTFTYTYASETCIQRKNGKYYDAYVMSSGDPVSNTDIIPANTVINVTVTGNGGYTGTITGSYRIAKNDISKSVCKINNQAYTGSPVTLTKEDFTYVKLGKQQLEFATDYRIVSYKNNIKNGKATVVIEGIGNYSGRKNITYSITRRPLRLFGQ